MNVLIKKEIRLILPAWIAAMLLAIFPIWIASYLWQVPTEVPLFSNAVLLGVLFLAIGSFGQEFSFRTFSLLLAQPALRRRIWTIKIIVLVSSFISVLLALFISWKIYSDWYHLGNWFYIFGLGSKFEVLAIVALAVLSGGLWTTILLRQVTAAFWFTILVPSFIIVLLDGLGSFFSFPQPQTDCCVLLFYSLAGFFWARKMFLSAQDTQWTGGEISFSWRKKISERMPVSNQSRHWFFALVRKEFQLHQVNILIAVLVLALHLTSVVVRKVHPHFENPDIKFVLETVWILWLAMPLLIGCAAVAEERRLGIVESQLCLPVSRRAQLVIKFSVALVLSLILGGMMPLVVERMHDLNLWIFVVAALIFFISFYASTLARTMLQAIGFTIGICAGLWAWVMAIEFSLGHMQRELINPYQAFFIFYLSAGILLLVLARLSFGNFKWLHENWKLWRRNLIAIVLSLAFGFTLANGIYFRAWELLTPVEPSHDAAHLTDSAQVKLASNGNTIYAISPDKKLWIETLAFEIKSNQWRGNFKILVPNRSRSRFIGDSNWVEVAADNYQTLGIQSNGSLWNLQKNPFEKQTDFKLVQIGSETNWSQVASGWGNEFLLFKKNGSLWIWGTNRYDWRKDFSLSQKLKLDSACPPARFGDETNWSELFSSGFAYVKKNDGSLWVATSWIGTNHAFALSQSTNLDGQLVTFTASGSASSVGVKTNGELWIFWDDWTSNKSIPRKTQLGKNAKWKVGGFTTYDSIIAIRSDGTLWKWPWLYQMRNNPDLIKPVQLGNHSDWITLSSSWNSVALAADGSLWNWNEPSAHVWLAPSRKPVFVGNIFQASKNE
jgi:ABC-type transport system involved in multi-copper enzyme maturation permease subunit